MFRKLSWRWFPIELYVFAIPSFLIMLGLLLFAHERLWLPDPEQNQVLALIISSLGLLQGLIGTVYFYAMVKLMRFLWRERKLAYARRFEAFVRVWGLRGAQFLFWVSVIVVSFSAIVQVTFILFRAFDHRTMAYASDLLLATDRMIFGFSPPFLLQWLAHAPRLEQLIVESYKHADKILALAVVVALLVKPVVFRKGIAAYLIVFWLALPIWWAVPALAPYDMYVKNVFNAPVPSEITSSLAQFPPGKAVKEFFPLLDAVYFDEGGKSFSVSTLPSTHMAWGIIVLFIAFELSPFLGAVALPWVILNAIGTMLVLEHYAIDVIAGLCIAVIAWKIAEALLIAERSYVIDKLGLEESLSVFSEDRKKLLRRIGMLKSPS